MVHEVRNQEELQAGRRRVVSLRRALLALAAALVLGGCASYTEETREIRELYREGGYPAALKKLEESGLKEDSKNRLLYRMEKASILDRMGEDQKARKTLLEADKIADELYTVSVSSTAASLVVSESQTDYDGEDYEKVAIHTRLALSFIGTGDTAAARVEARRINLELQKINEGYEENKNRYGEDAFALYLAGTIYDARGEIDSAIIDYAKAVDLYRGAFADFSDGGVPDGLVKAYARVLLKRRRADALAKLEKDFPKLVAEARKSEGDDTGEVVVVHELGHIATKSTEEFALPIGKQIIRFSFPVIRRRGGGSYKGNTGFSASPGYSFTGADNTADMDAIAAATLEDRRGRMIAKQAARLLAKGQLTEQAYEHFGPLGGIAANVFSAVTETADTRSWTLLPEAFYVSRQRLKPGTYTIEIKTGGRLERAEKVEVKKDQVVILRGVG